MVEKADSTDVVDQERRRISVLMALALLGGATVTITGCGGGGTTAPTSPVGPAGAARCPAGSRCGLVSTDPLHSAEITAAQLSAGGALTLDIQGSQNHGHLVSLSSDEVVTIREGRQVNKVSTTALLHNHRVTFN